MSQPVPQHPSATDAARSDQPSAPSADRPLPEFPSHVPPPGPHSPIEREIERSERASAALAAARALARASFTDSELAAEGAATSDVDSSGWVRTEYAALDHSGRNPQDDAQGNVPPRNLVGGSFNPGIASQHGRAFPGASIGQAPIKTRSGAQARFHHEARHTPRPERAAPASAPAAGLPHHDKPAVLPTLAPVAKAAVAPSGERFKFALAAGVGAVVVLIGGGVALKAGLFSRPDVPAAALASVQAARPAAQPLATPVLAVPASPQDIAIAPAAGVPSARSSDEVNAALAAAARAAAVPVASVHAAGPARVARPLPVAPAVATPVAPPTAAASTSAQHAPEHGKDSVAAAIANAQARADNFLASGSSATPASPAADAKQPQ